LWAVVELARLEWHGRTRPQPSNGNASLSHAHKDMHTTPSLSHSVSLSFSLLLLASQIRGKFGGALTGMHGLGVWVWVGSPVGSCGAREAGGVEKDEAEHRRHASTVERQHLYFSPSLARSLTSLAS